GSIHPHEAEERMRELMGVVGWKLGAYQAALKAWSETQSRWPSGWAMGAVGGHGAFSPPSTIPTSINTSNLPSTTVSSSNTTETTTTASKASTVASKKTEQEKPASPPPSPTPTVRPTPSILSTKSVNTHTLPGGWHSSSSSSLSSIASTSFQPANSYINSRRAPAPRSLNS